jgi:hypothetical protein
MPFNAASRSELERTFGRSPIVERTLLRTAKEGAANATRLAPKLPGGRAPKLSAGVRLTPQGIWEGFTKASGSFWHLPEFGAVNFPIRPYLRPGVNAAIARRGGRMKENTR